MVGLSPLSGVWSLGDVRNNAGETAAMTAAMTAARSNAHRFLRRARVGQCFHSEKRQNPAGVAR